MKNRFDSGQEVRWCPGCGDYAILRAVQKTLETASTPKENMVFISGIGCSSRFPYYLNTYGFHTIHGRAPTIATGLKMVRPELDVWLITGDGDGLSIGTNHLLHMVRRNLDITVLLFNNRIYGLTKGQASPTSECGKVTKSTPFGSATEPFEPIKLIEAAGGAFIARGIDVDAQGLSEIFAAAMQFKGTKFIEIYQNCNVFNDGAFDAFATREQRPGNTVFVRAGQPLLFANATQGLLVTPEGVQKVAPQEASVFDPTQTWMMRALLEMPFPEFPVPIGFFKQEARPIFGHNAPQPKSLDLAKALKGSMSWNV